MIYDLSNDLQAEQFKARIKLLLSKKPVVELSEKKPRRTVSQNNYLHLILSYFAVETGNTLEWVKQQYFKRLVNSDIFVREKEDKFTGNTLYWRSSSDLNTQEMNVAITRFRNWSAETAGIYLPDANEERLLQLMQIDISRNKFFI